MKDPKMDRIFKNAYYATLKVVERREIDKSVQDHINAYVELFEQELDRRDLTAEEQRAFLEAFKTTMKQADLHRQKMRKTRKRFFTIGGGSIAVVVLLAFILHVCINRPFMPLTKVEADLQYYLERVDSGFWEFSEKY